MKCPKCNKIMKLWHPPEYPDELELWFGWYCKFCDVSYSQDCELKVGKLKLLEEYKKD